MQQRYYDPRVGRFWSVDPVTVDSVGGNFNRYWYGNNNPYRFTDPDGRLPVTPDVVIDAAFIIYDTGRFLGAATAAVVGTATGNDALQSAGLEGMRDTGADLGASTASAAIPGLTAPVARGALKGTEAVVDVAKSAERVRGSVNVTSRSRTVNQALTTGQRFVGKGAQEVAPGVFRSADGTRQFRMTDADITGAHGKIGPHVHFEKFNPATGEKIKNIHTPLVDP